MIVSLKTIQKFNELGHRCCTYRLDTSQLVPCENPRRGKLVRTLGSILPCMHASRLMTYQRSAGSVYLAHYRCAIKKITAAVIIMIKDWLPSLYMQSDHYIIYIAGTYNYISPNINFPYCNRS